MLGIDIDQPKVDGNYRLDHAVTKTLKVILSLFGLDENSIVEKADEISKLLAISQTLMNKEEPDDGEEENYSID